MVCSEINTNAWIQWGKWGCGEPPTGLREPGDRTRIFPAPAGIFRVYGQAPGLVLRLFQRYLPRRHLLCVCVCVYTDIAGGEWSGRGIIPPPLSLSLSLSLLELPPFLRAEQHDSRGERVNGSHRCVQESLSLSLSDTHLEITTWLGTWAWGKVVVIEILLLRSCLRRFFLQQEPAAKHFRRNSAFSEDPLPDVCTVKMWTWPRTRSSASFHRETLNFCSVRVRVTTTRRFLHQGEWRGSRRGLRYCSNMINPAQIQNTGQVSTSRGDIMECATRSRRPTTSASLLFLFNADLSCFII